jgi:hypothetical protein
MGSGYGDIVATPIKCIAVHLITHTQYILLTSSSEDLNLIVERIRYSEHRNGFVWLIEPLSNCDN